MIEIREDNVGELLNRLVEMHCGLKAHLFSQNGQLASHVNVFVNDENIRDREGLGTLVKDSDEIVLVPAMAGG